MVILFHLLLSPINIVKPTCIEIYCMHKYIANRDIFSIYMSLEKHEHFVYLDAFLHIHYCVRLSQKRPLQEDRRRVVSDFANNEVPGGKRRWQGSNGEPKTVFSRLSARVPSNNDDSADEDDNAIKVKL